MGEHVPLFSAKTFADLSVYLLFIVFLIAYAILWKNELISGILLIVWYGLQWVLVFWVWTDGALTLVFGLPIGVIGLLLLIYGILKNSSIFSKKNDF